MRRSTQEHLIRFQAESLESGSDALDSKKIEHRLHAKPLTLLRAML
jgi:hypothetical protein